MEKIKQGKRERKCRAGAAILLICLWSGRPHSKATLEHREGSVGISHRDRKGERIQVRGKPI